MSGYVLIDPPVTPYSPRSEILEWIEVCQEALAKASDCQEWKVALAYAQDLLRYVDSSLPNPPARQS